MTYRLPKAERICGKSTIDQLFSSGSRFHEQPFRIVWRIQNRTSGAPFRFGISVPKKVSKLAHERNRIKRLVREALRKSAGSLRNKLSVTNKQLDFFIIYSGTVQPLSSEISLKIILILERLIHLHESHSPFGSDRNDQTL
jgi:ribonuclease P protein component